MPKKVDNIIIRMTIQDNKKWKNPKIRYFFHFVRNLYFQDDATFTITVDGKTFHFQAQDSEERERWIRALEETVLRLVSNIFCKSKKMVLPLFFLKY